MHMELRYSVKRCDEKHVKLSSMFSEVEIGYNKNRCIEKHVKLWSILNKIEDLMD